MKDKKKLLLALTAATTLAVGACTFSACDLSFLPGFGVTQEIKVTLSEENVELVVGEGMKLVATATDGAEIVWSSSDENVVTVRNGRITAVGAGEATVTASCGAIKATCTVKVVAVNIVLSETSATVERGETLTLTATADRDGEIVWSSSDETVVTVENGVIKAKKEGTATITATYGNTACKSTCEVTVVWTNKPADYAELAEGGETDALAAPGKFIVWNDHVDWCGTDVSVAQKEYMNESVHLEYSGVQNSVWFGMQLFYKNPSNQADKKYHLTMDIESAAAGDVTINGSVITLAEGKNHVEVYYTEAGDKASLSMQMGVNGGEVIEENTLVLSNISFEEYTPVTLSAPTALTIGEDGSLTVTDENEDHASAYELTFYQNDALVYKVSVAAGEKLENSFMEDGEYSVKVKAIGGGMYLDSAESAVLTTYTVSNGGISYDLGDGGSEAAVANPGKFYYWTEFAGVTNAKFNNGTLSFDIVAGGNWYSNQFFMKDSSLKVGTRYTLTMKINSTVEGHIAINGNNVTLTEGENLISVRYTEKDNEPSFSMQFGSINGTADISEGTFTVSDIKYTEGMTFNESNFMEGAEDDAKAFPGHFFYWTEFAGITGGEFKDGTLTFSFGNNGNWYSNQIFYRAPDLQDGAQYRLTFNLNSTAAGHIRINGQNTDIVEGNNAISVDYTQVGGGTSINMQMGIFWWEDGEHGDVNIPEADFVISDIQFTKISGGTDAPTPPPTDTIDVDTIDRSNATTVNLELADKYGDVYMFFWLKTEADMTKTSYVRVNGTRSDFLEMNQHEVEKTTYAFRTKVGDLTLESYVFDFYDAEGNVFATATYTTKSTNPDPNPEQPNPGQPDTPVDAAAVELTFVEAYGDHYFHFNATSTAAIKTAAYVKVNGTQQWAECSGEGPYAFKVFVGDLKLESYTFEWFNAEGKVFAKATYTPKPTNPDPNPEQPNPGQPDTPVDAAAVELTFVEAYGDHYFHFNATSTAEIKTAAYVKVNGTQQWAECSGEGPYAFKVFVGDLNLESYTFEWFNAEGKVFAKATYTPNATTPNPDPDPDTPNPDEPYAPTDYENIIGEANMTLGAYIDACTTAEATPFAGGVLSASLPGTMNYAMGGASDGKYLYLSKCDNTNTIVFKYKTLKDGSYQLMATSAMVKTANGGDTGRIFIKGDTLYVVSNYEDKLYSVNLAKFTDGATFETCDLPVADITGIKDMDYTEGKGYAVVKQGELYICDESGTATCKEALGYEGMSVASVATDENYIYVSYVANAQQTLPVDVFTWEGTKLTTQEIGGVVLTAAGGAYNAQAIFMHRGRMYAGVCSWAVSGYHLYQITVDQTVLGAQYTSVGDYAKDGGVAMNGTFVSDFVNGVYGMGGVSDGTHLYLACNTPGSLYTTIYQVDPETNTVLAHSQQLKVYPGETASWDDSSRLFIKDSKIYIVPNATGKMFVANLADFQADSEAVFTEIDSVLDVNKLFMAVSYNATAERFAATGRGDGKLYIYDKDSKLLNSIALPANGWGVTSDDNYIYVNYKGADGKATTTVSVYSWDGAYVGTMTLNGVGLESTADYNIQAIFMHNGTLYASVCSWSNSAYHLFSLSLV